MNDFSEVKRTITEDKALELASMCLNCKIPMCVQGCPVNIKINEFIECITKKDYIRANEIIEKNSDMASICGRVCPQEKQCEQSCIKNKMNNPVKIGELERFIGDMFIDLKCENCISNNYHVACIGSGPSSLQCASDLLKKGYNVDIYESLNKAGGVLRYGIPEFRLPERIVDSLIKKIESRGAKFIYNTLIGKNVTIDNLLDKYDAVFIGTGAGLPKFLNIEGEDLPGVFSANELLTRINLLHANEENSLTPFVTGNKAIVIGGGNVAFDAARTLKRLGFDTTISYRKDEEHLKARKEEIEFAKKEGINFIFNYSPKRFIGDKKLKKIILKETEGNKEISLDVDCAIVAIGTNSNLTAVSNSNIKIEDNLIFTDIVKTSKEKVYAGGDVVTGSATVISAIEMGSSAATSIDDYLKNRKSDSIITVGD